MFVSQHQVAVDAIHFLAARRELVPGFRRERDQVRGQQAFLEAARQRRAESDVRYRSGLMTYEEWQLVVIDLVNFEKSFLRSEQNLLLAEAQWRFAAGQQLGE